MGRASGVGAPAPRPSVRSLSAQTQSKHVDPGHAANLTRSLRRNDTELAALSQLHAALRTLRAAIVDEFGEAGLLRCVVNESKRPPAATEAREDSDDAIKAKDPRGAGKDVGEDADGDDSGDIDTASDDSDSDSDNDDGSASASASAGLRDEDTRERRFQRLAAAFLLRTRLRRP